MSKLLKKIANPFTTEQTGFIISFIIPNCIPVGVELVDIISYVEDYELNTADIDGSEIYNPLTSAEFFEQNTDKVLALYFNRFILSNLKFLNDESQAYVESKRRAA